MKNIISLFIISFFIVPFSLCQFDENKIMQSNVTPTYEELIEFYKHYAAENDDIQLYNMGASDYGLPIYLCVLNADQDSTKTFEKARNNTTLLVNNGIHPGEPCGINACMQYVVDFTNLDEEIREAHPITGIIPIYNVGGMKNRSSYSRANQDGPLEYGFRGNTKNLDLNRDFIKMDSQNMWVFAKIFHALDPDVFIDTHTTNGADYHYVMTYIVPLYDRMPKATRDLLFDNMIPFLERVIKFSYNYTIFPYVSMNDKTLDKGIHAFNPLPRYAMGYADLFNSLSFTTETHMLKPFEERVRSTYAFISEVTEWISDNHRAIEKAREEAFKEQLNKDFFELDFKASETHDSILFKGYEWDYKPSELTADDRLFYDEASPFEKYIPYNFRYEPTNKVNVPKYYILGGQEKDVLERLKANQIEYTTIKKDTTINAKYFRVVDYETVSKPYEGHYLHSKLKVDEETKVIDFKTGDILIPTQQKHKRFLVSTLDPRMEDSYFAWNFFDSYLQQKEYFSPYIFEDIAVELIKDNPKIEREFREKQSNDKEFAANRWQQLYFLYKRSPYYEPSHNIIPVYSVD